RSAVPRMRRSKQAPVAASGFIGDDAPARKPASTHGGFHDSKQRLAKATEMLSKAKNPEAVGRVLDALEEFDVGDLLAILPTISELGYQAVPALVGRLSAARREVRQSVAILLGLANDARALDALCQRLMIEDTTVWADIARAVGSFGPRAIGPLSELLQDVPASKLDFTVARCGRAMAEIVISDGDDEAGPGRVAIESMIDVNDAALSAAAREALGTLRDVKSAGEMVRGERPLNEDTAIRGFSRRAYEAIMVPEIDLLVDVEDLDEIPG
ncbi:MAG: HEAT repeat domain-containing protein, partial [Nannocystaceae bacterium]